MNGNWPCGITSGERNTMLGLCLIDCFVDLSLLLPRSHAKALTGIPMTSEQYRTQSKQVCGTMVKVLLYAMRAL
jgi:hypothetical protein